MAFLRRPALHSAALRARVERLSERMETLPKPPFAVAVVVAVVLLAAALADATPDERVAEVGMFAPSTSETEGVGEGLVAEAIEILEHGFGRIELDGAERLTVGAVVHNSHPTYEMNLQFEVTAADGDSVDAFLVSLVPPDSDVLIGRILTEGAADSDEAELELALKSVSFQLPSRGYFPERFTVLEVEPLLSPEGHRISYRIESELDHADGVRPDVVFRGADGAIVGGVGGDDRVVDGADANASVNVYPGASVHHFNLRSEEIPEGADLLTTEIGPGGVIPGG